jgi:3-oxoacyl-[acyl-carrier protein] reductase
MTAPNPGPVVAVTGAASGMGRAVAREFASRGWAVLGMDVELAGMKPLSADFGDRIVPARVDIRDRASIGAALRQHGDGLTAVASVAGVYPPTSIDTYTEELYRFTFDVNVLGTLNLAAETAPYLAKAGHPTTFVTFSSPDGWTPKPQQVLYAASKAAVTSLNRTLAISLADQGISVVGIAPGWVDTPGNAATGRMQGVESRIPLGRVAQPEEIARWVWHLAGSGELGYITGETIMVNGGILMR